MNDHEEVLWALGAASVVTFFVTLLVMPAIAIRIGADYFAYDQRPSTRWADRHPAVRLALLIGKNLLGCLLIAGGLAMLVLPGQGLLTLLIGLLMLDFPYKYRFERWLVRRRHVLRTINWLRRRAGRGPLQVDAVPDESGEHEVRRDGRS